MDKKKILIIDDEKDFTAIVRLNLQSTNQYEVKEVNDSTEALSAAREFNPDLIILDILMPGIDGGSVARELKADELCRNIPIIFLTAAITEEEARTHAGIVGDHPFMAKPVTTCEIVARIEEYIKK